MSKSKSVEQMMREMRMGDPRKIRTEEYKRSNHEDFATSGELRDRQFSGYRMNTLIDELEIWIKGRLMGRVKAPNGQPDPDAVQREFNRIFGVES